MEENSGGKFGGANSIVEMDESCFFKRKFNRGRRTAQIWGFGFVERKTGRFFVEIVSNRSASTLLGHVKKHNSPHTDTLITDEWKAYMKLQEMGYRHHTIKHKQGFIHPNDPNVHTQTIERKWGGVRSSQ